jgi:hypothetical protein
MKSCQYNRDEKNSVLIFLLNDKQWFQVGNHGEWFFFGNHVFRNFLFHDATICGENLRTEFPQNQIQIANIKSMLVTKYKYQY